MKHFKTTKNYYIVSIGLIVFSKIYNLFGHGVNSLYMDYAFVVPIVFAIVFNILFLKQDFDQYDIVSFKYYFNVAMIFLCDFMILSGILEIAGAFSVYLFIMLQAGMFYLMISLIVLARLKHAKVY